MSLKDLCIHTVPVPVINKRLTDRAIARAGAQERRLIRWLERKVKSRKMALCAPYSFYAGYREALGDILGFIRKTTTTKK